MRYRTLIEIVCDASSKDEAINLAGDYLRGEVDGGVTMKCGSAPLYRHRLRKYTLASVLTVMVVGFMFIGAPQLQDNAGTGTKQLRLSDSYTMMPELKTKHRSDFRKEWEKKKDEAILDFIKN
ncbi:MAG: hypothetical protein PHH49_03725 [Candidatus Omnitrophica bacterium]|nr:hypothetical protein [Candidatus Omnitrophota bacterium]MDD5488058.1 hypothetical protein [Candidatus Omnitrophota bacterium]